MRAFILSLITLSLCSSLASTAGPQDSEAPDIRLSQKVTYEASHKPVKVILSDLSKITGVTLNAGHSISDWQVRDRRMNIFVKDLPLLSLMNSMGRVMKFIWTKNDKLDPPTYRMYMDRKELAAAQAAKTRTDQELSHTIEQSRAETIDYLTNLPEYTSDEIEQLKKENPYLYLMHKRGTDKLLQSLFQEYPDSVDALVRNDRSLSIPVTDLSERTRSLLRTAVQTDVPVIWEGDGPKEALSKDAAAQNLKDGSILLGVWPRQSVGHPAQRLSCLGRIEFYVPGDRKGMYLEHLWTIDNPATLADCKAELDALDHSIPLEESLRTSWPERALARRENERMAEEILGSEPPTEHPDEPWLHAKTKVQWEDDAHRLSSALATVSKAFESSIVSDSFASARCNGTLSSGELEIGDVLKNLSDCYGYNWQKPIKTLEFRKRDWFRLRCAQIPDEWMDRWKANFKKNGVAVLADIAQMAALTSEQLYENVFRDPVFTMSPDFCWTIQNCRRILRFYSTLTPTQRKLLSTVGLELDALSPEQMEVTLAAIDGRDTGKINPPRFWEDPDENIKFVGRSDKTAEGEPAYLIRALGKDGKAHRAWRIPFRKYVEPPQEKEK